jgi:hypothetical protein
MCRLLVYRIISSQKLSQLVYAIFDIFTFRRTQNLVITSLAIMEMRNLSGENKFEFSALNNCWDEKLSQIPQLYSVNK